MKKNTTFRFTEGELDALGEALTLAYDDQNHYLSYSDPEKDYGDEWPEALKRKAHTYRNLAAACRRLGFPVMAEQWDDLAEDITDVKETV